MHTRGHKIWHRKNVVGIRYRGGGVMMCMHMFMFHIYMSSEALVFHSTFRGVGDDKDALH